VTGVGAQQPEDGALVRELAERLIASPRLGPGAQRLTVELLPGRLPQEFAGEIMLPPRQHRLLGSAVRRTADRPAGATAALAPAGMELLPSSPQPLPGGGKPALATSDAIAVTTMDVAVLAEHFARQLEGAGWARGAARLDGPLAWILWRVPGDGDWQGVLYVV